MPFTFAHPAIILLLTYLHKKWYSLSGLVIGSMTPDFEYFIRMKDKSMYSHTIAGIFYFDLPLAVILSFAFHLVVRNPLIIHLPPFLKKRFTPFLNFNWTACFKKNWPVILVSFMIGAFSHIFWDDFTHYKGYFVREIPSMKHFFRIGRFYIRYYNLIQHVSTVVGSLIVGYAIVRMPVSDDIEPVQPSRYWFWVFAIASILMLGRCLSGIDHKIFGDIIISVISCGLWGLMLAPVFLRKLVNPKRRHA